MASTKKNAHLEALRREFKNHYGWKPVGLSEGKLIEGIREAKEKQNRVKAEKATDWKDSLPDGYTE